MAPQHEELMGVEYANLDRLHLRIVEEPEKYMSDEQLAKLKALREWTVDVPRPDAYGEASAAFALPALPTGKYRLLLAPTAHFAKGMAYVELHVTDIALRYTTDGRGLVVDRECGAPVAGQKVQLVQPKQYYPKQDERVLQTVVTAADGTYRFDSIPPRYSIIRIVRDGYNFVQSAYSHNHTATDGHKTQFHMASDRPVYRPGDTVQVAMLLYRTDGRDGELLAAGHTFTLTLTDPNGQQVQQLKLTPEGFTDFSKAAAVKLSAVGSELYCSNRGHESLAVFAVDASTGALTRRGIVKLDGAFPWDFELLPGEKVLAVGFQKDGVLRTYRYDKAACTLTPLADAKDMGSTFCTTFLSVSGTN
jgi:hypothetical protein